MRDPCGIGATAWGLDKGPDSVPGTASERPSFTLGAGERREDTSSAPCPSPARPKWQLKSQSQPTPLQKPVSY